MQQIINKLKFNEFGLIPTIAQDINSKKVLMLAWMNKESLDLTIKTGFATYFSRSRNELWKKGDTSGHLQKIHKITVDCDHDCILLEVEQSGCACHTGSETCFFNQVLS
ncbi:MAG: phosphoribosyl-AMP cyclohydrolase [Alphaproteobacteria bacterium]|nr:phosphoribosyl-AMP cyclohydrolase [Alphaproteobacteria bacterium]